MPKYGSLGAACFDLACYLPSGDVEIPPNKTVKVETGLKFQLPPNHVMRIYPRGSTGITHDLELVNTVGILDCDYRGQCYLFIKNNNSIPFIITHGMRLFQAEIQETFQVDFTEVSKLDETVRGSGYNGSTGQ